MRRSYYAQQRHMRQRAVILRAVAMPATLAAFALLGCVLCVLCLTLPGGIHASAQARFGAYVLAITFAFTASVFLFATAVQYCEAKATR